MKKALSIIIILLLILNIFLNCLGRKDQKEQVNDMYNHIDSIMRHRSHLDTLYWNHLEQCAFEVR